MSRHVRVLNLLVLTGALTTTGYVLAQDHSAHATPPVAKHDHSQHDMVRPLQPETVIPDPSIVNEHPVANDAMDHSQMDHSQMHHGTMDHGSMDHAVPAAPAPITPIPEVTEVDRVAAFPVLTQHMEHAPEINHYVVFNHLEAWDADTGSGQAWSAAGWVGSDLNRLWIRSEGERIGGSTESADVELLYGRSITPWWDIVVGVKHDFLPGETQNWAAIGLQGLAPYQFDVEATVYLSDSGQTQFALDLDYDLLLTNRLILQPVVEVQLFGKNDPARAIGSGLSKVETGLRLRYEIHRKFAPYIGVVHERTFGSTADFRQARGEEARDTRFVAGVRVWF